MYLVKTDEKLIWIRNQPSAIHTIREFTGNHLKVVHDVDSGFISISVEHLSLIMQRLILENIIIGINNHMRERRSLLIAIMQLNI